MSRPTIKYPIPYTKIKPSRACRKKRVGGTVVPNNVNISGIVMLPIKKDTETIQLKKAPIINNHL
jgi:hypothetical protein